MKALSQINNLEVRVSRWLPKCVSYLFSIFYCVAYVLVSIPILKRQFCNFDNSSLLNLIRADCKRHHVGWEVTLQHKAGHVAF